MQLKWFNSTLKDERSDIVSKPPVIFFVMGGGAKKNKFSRTNHGGHCRFEN